MNTVLIVYDIPDKSTARNPSPRLRRLGVRVNLSCWVLPEDQVPYLLLDDLTANGATWHMVRFAESEGENLARLAVEALRKDVERLVERLKASVVKAADKLAPDAADRAVAAKAFQRRTAVSLRRARRLLDDARQAARAFGVDVGGAADNALRGISAIKASADARCHLYAQATGLLKDEVLRATAQADALPAYAVADALEEQGQGVEEFRAAFE